MRLPTLLLAVAGLSAIVVAGASLRERLGAGVVPLAQQGKTEQTDALDAPKQAEGRARVDPPSRPVTPSPARVRPVARDYVALPPVDAGELERIDPREPLGSIGRAVSPDQLPPAQTILHRPVTHAAGTFEALGHAVVLAGIEVTPADMRCGDGATEWPCGIHARTAFRNFLRGRAPSCVVPALPGSEPVTTECNLGAVDPAVWLVEQGWARAVPGGPYATLEETARSQRRGIFGDAPAAAKSVTITVPDFAPLLEDGSGG